MNCKSRILIEKVKRSQMNILFLVIGFMIIFTGILFAQQLPLQITSPTQQANAAYCHEGFLYMDALAGPANGFPNYSKETNRSWYFRSGVALLDLNGTKRLVRGTRKVVTTDAEGGLLVDIQAGYRVSARYSLMIGFNRLKSNYTHTEDFTNGKLITTTDDLSLSILLGGINYHLTQKRSIDFYFGAHLAYIAYNDELRHMSEQSLPEDLSTINSTPFNLSVHNTIGVGFIVGGDLPLGKDGWFLSSSIGITLAWMPADIIDDPEDPENGNDIMSPMHPSGVRFAIGYRF